MNTLALIKKLRKEKGMSQQEIAERLSISQSAYLQIEKGNTELTVSRLEKLAEILEVPLFQLMGIEDNRQAKIAVLTEKVGKATIPVKMQLEQRQTLEELLSQRITFWVEAISIIHKMILAKGLEMRCFDFKVHSKSIILDYPTTIYKKAIENPVNTGFETNVLSAFPTEELEPVLDALFQDELFRFLARNIPFDVGLRTEEYERSRRKGKSS